jgi:hypothetical protein
MERPWDRHLLDGEAAIAPNGAHARCRRPGGDHRRPGGPGRRGVGAAPPEPGADPRAGARQRHPRQVERLPPHRRRAPGRRPGHRHQDHRHPRPHDHPRWQRSPGLSPRRPNVAEQIRIVRTAAQLGAEALVIECMALQPSLQWLSEWRFVRATHGVITNARPDHLDVMGPTETDVARALAGMVPPGQKLFTAERDHLGIFADACADAVHADSRSARPRSRRSARTISRASPTKNTPTTSRSRSPSAPISASTGRWRSMACGRRSPIRAR